MTSIKPTITALAPWYGSKRTLAPRIVEALGPHRCYWEPFCGSLAVLFGKPVATMETVNDLHQDVTNLARVLQDRREWVQLYRCLLRTLPSKELKEEADEYLISVPFVPGHDRAYSFFVSSWLGRNGSVGSTSGNNFCVRYTSNGGSPGTRFRAAVDSIPEWVVRLRGVIVLNEDAFGLLDRIEDKGGTVIYCDPPYLMKGAKYVHDFKTSDHDTLANLLRRFKKTRVVVSYYDHDSLVGLYPGWRKIAATTTKSMVSAGRRDSGGRVDAPEVLLVNS